MPKASRLIFLLALFSAIGWSAATAGVTGDPDKGYAASEPPRCRGANLVNRLATSDPSLHDRIVEAAGATENGDALLWKIERSGRPPSHLFGTVHLTDARVRAISSATRTALRNARHVLLETSEVSSSATTRALLRAAKAAVYTDGRTLDALLTKDEFKKVLKTVGRSGIPAKAVRLYRPWMISMLLSGSACERRRLQEGEVVLDMALAEEARIHGIPVTGLETADEQIKILASVPEDQQIGMLRANLALIDDTDNLMETMIQLYLDRQIGAVWELQMVLAEEAGVSSSSFDGFRQAVIVDRNATMLDASLPAFNKGGVFMAVGALHLPGEKGLVALLRRAGYTVTPVE